MNCTLLHPNLDELHPMPHLLHPNLDDPSISPPKLCRSNENMHKFPFVSKSLPNKSYKGSWRIYRCSTLHNFLLSVYSYETYFQILFMFNASSKICFLHDISSSRHRDSGIIFFVSSLPKSQTVNLATIGKKEDILNVSSPHPLGNSIALW